MHQVQKKDWKKDTVYLYQFPRSKYVPNVSPFCLKVETFLKANKIPYEICSLVMGRSQYGMLPFVELNGEHIADSQIIINRLSKHFDVKPLSSPKDEAIARAVDRMVDTHTFL
ncbi:hypothetical protein OESDEN_20721 [Oesophagostomum dentatum]|uniref:Thioredoxin-like fold domain-containing protein n=1 Tax=Oesophagostomum dentatum TaxID=61180 RepID=A0A0B1S825_OESDE|nr:hypothetical protein OESDEN_20721 [Oesophagostomum dentatum]